MKCTKCNFRNEANLKYWQLDGSNYDTVKHKTWNELQNRVKQFVFIFFYVVFFYLCNGDFYSHRYEYITSDISSIRWQLDLYYDTDKVVLTSMGLVGSARLFVHAREIWAKRNTPQKEERDEIRNKKKCNEGNVQTKAFEHLKPHASYEISFVWDEHCIWFNIPRNCIYLSWCLKIALICLKCGKWTEIQNAWQCTLGLMCLRSLNTSSQRDAESTKNFYLDARINIALRKV